MRNAHEWQAVASEIQGVADEIERAMEAQDLVGARRKLQRAIQTLDISISKLLHKSSDLDGRLGEVADSDAERMKRMKKLLGLSPHPSAPEHTPDA